jgi:hypothetical protein
MRGKLDDVGKTGQLTFTIEGKTCQNCPDDNHDGPWLWLDITVHSSQYTPVQVCARDALANSYRTSLKVSE